MDRDDRPEPVVLAAEHHLQFLALDFAACLVKGRLGLARRFRVVAAFLFGHREEQARLIDRRAQSLEASELFVDAVVFLERGLGGIGPIPEAGLAGFYKQFFVADFETSDVKDASRAYRCGFRNRLADRAFR
jgi:hypothetical protein